MNSSIRSIRQILARPQTQVAFAVVLGLLIFIYVLLGIRGDVDVPREIDLGVFSIQLYSLSIITAVLVCVWAFNLMRKGDPELEKIDVWDGLLIVIIPAILGARIYHVLTDFYLYQNDLLGIFEIWNGGLGIIGGLIGGLIGVVWYLNKKQIPIKKTLGIIVVVVPIGQAVGRLGNFFNQELFGLPADGLPWAMYVPVEQNPIFFLHNYEYFHPLFLYEAVLSITLFVFLWALWRRKVYPSTIVIMYILGYGLIRYLLDFLRVDGRAGIGYFTYAQILIMGVVLFMFVFGVGYQFWYKRKYGKWFTDKSELDA